MHQVTCKLSVSIFDKDQTYAAQRRGGIWYIQSPKGNWFECDDNRMEQCFTLTVEPYKTVTAAQLHEMTSALLQGAFSPKQEEVRFSVVKVLPVQSSALYQPPMPVKEVVFRYSHELKQWILVPTSLI